MPYITILSDFDGTLTGAEGRKAVFSLFYNSLFIRPFPGYSVPGDYKTLLLKEPAVVAKLFEENDSELREMKMLMSDKAVEFLHKALHSVYIKVMIVTKNRADYIVAMLKYQGFSEYEISRLTIKDSGHKFEDVSEELRTYPSRPTHFYVLDDNADDLHEMVRAVEGSGVPSTNISSYHCGVGDFAWDRYQIDIKEKIMPMIFEEGRKERLVLDTIDQLSTSPGFLNVSLNVFRNRLRLIINNQFQSSPKVLEPFLQAYFPDSKRRVPFGDEAISAYAIKGCGRCWGIDKDNIMSIEFRYLKGWLSDNDATDAMNAFLMPYSGSSLQSIPHGTISGLGPSKFIYAIPALTLPPALMAKCCMSFLSHVKTLVDKRHEILNDVITVKGAQAPAPVYRGIFFSSPPPPEAVRSSEEDVAPSPDIDPRRIG